MTASIVKTPGAVAVIVTLNTSPLSKYGLFPWTLITPLIVALVPGTQVIVVRLPCTKLSVSPVALKVKLKLSVVVQLLHSFIVKLICPVIVFVTPSDTTVAVVSVGPSTIRMPHPPHGLPGVDGQDTNVGAVSLTVILLTVVVAVIFIAVGSVPAGTVTIVENVPFASVVTGLSSKVTFTPPSLVNVTTAFATGTPLQVTVPLTIPAQVIVGSTFNVIIGFVQIVGGGVGPANTAGKQEIPQKQFKSTVTQIPVLVNKTLLTN